jgi:hypothetical protein
MLASNNSLLDFYREGRSNITFNLMYSFHRATPPEQVTYQPLILDEKDPIQHKYGLFWQAPPNRDPNSQLMTSQQQVLRHDPNKPIVWYFAKGYPEDYKGIFMNPGGLVDQTNAVLAASGAKARVQFYNYDDLNTYGDHAGPAREYGDVRYSFIRFESSLDSGSPFLGVTSWYPDPRTGEVLASSITIAGTDVKTHILQWVDAYLTSVGASYGLNSPDPWPDGPPNCQDGDTMPIVPATVTNVHDADSTLFYEMQKAFGQPD